MLLMKLLLCLKYYFRQKISIFGFHTYIQGSKVSTAEVNEAFKREHENKLPLPIYDGEGCLETKRPNSVLKQGATHVQKVSQVKSIKVL